MPEIERRGLEKVHAGGELFHAHAVDRATLLEARPDLPAGSPNEIDMAKLLSQSVAHLRRELVAAVLVGRIGDGGWGHGEGRRSKRSRRSRRTT
jgi:hypothetical protein